MVHDGNEPRAVSVSILKGGVGKSTIAVNLADRLAAQGYDVLFIDLDPNGHASVGLGFKEQYNDDAADDIGDVILDGGDQAPADVIHDTGFGFDILPSTSRLETIEDLLRSSSFPDVRVRKYVTDPLLGEEYDYIVTDSPAYRGKIADNALIATQNLIIPLTSGGESVEGFGRMMERQITPLREQIRLDILAIVPNRIRSRIDHQNSDRRLIERLNRDFEQYVPSFARITDREFERIDNGEMKPLPKPGMRKDDSVSESFTNRQPLAHHNPDSGLIDHFDQLADVVIEGKIDGR